MTSVNTSRYNFFMEIFSKKHIHKVFGSEKKTLEDNVALEVKMRILVNGKDQLSLYCSPSMVRELVTGLVMSEGIIEGSYCLDRMSIEYNDEILVDIPADGNISDKGAIRTSGCIGGVTYEHDDDIQKVTKNKCIRGDRLIDLFAQFQKISKPYQLTGCIHSAAISSDKSILILAEDIGRHNAVDKVIGYCLLEDIPMDDKIMLVSGRLSSEIAYKCARWQIPIVTSRTAPTMRAIDIAEKAGVTLIGFMREKRYNIYSHSERIL